MSRSKKIIVAFMLLMMMTMNLAAQEKEVEMADTMRSNGRIWVVVAVMLTILAGLLLYLWRLDRKIGKLEKEN